MFNQPKIRFCRKKRWDNEFIEVTAKDAQTTKLSMGSYRGYFFWFMDVYGELLQPTWTMDLVPHNYLAKLVCKYRLCWLWLRRSTNGIFQLVTELGHSFLWFVSIDYGILHHTIRPLPHMVTSLKLMVTVRWTNSWPLKGVHLLESWIVIEP